MFDHQKAFDTAVAGLWEQAEFSINDGGDCMYRGQNGCRCAVGFLIPDERYYSGLENATPDIEKVQDAIEPEGLSFADITFLSTMQYRLHDKLSERYNWDDDTFKAAVLDFADQNKLKVDVNLFTPRETVNG